MVYRLKSLLYKSLNDLGGHPQAVTIEDFLHANNCTYHHNTSSDGKKEHYYFKYQGGNFIASVDLEETDNKHVLLIFPAFCSVGAKYVNHVRSMCNYFNNSTYIHKLVYNYDEEEDQYTVDITYGINEISQAALAGSLEYCFKIQKAFNDAINEYVDDHKNIEDPEDGDNGSNHELHLMREMAMRQIPDKGLDFKAGDEKASTVGTVLRALYGDRALPLTMTAVAAGGEAVTVTEMAKIMDYDLGASLLYIDGKTGELTSHRSVVIAVTMADVIDNRNSVTTITLVSSAADEGAFYYEVTATISQPPTSPSHPVEAKSLLGEPKSISFTAALYTTDDAKKRHHEFDYMWKDAQDKIAAGNRSELSSDQRVMADITDVDAAYCAYWGHKLLRQHRYLEAALVLEPGFAKLKRQWGKASDKVLNVFYNISFLTGVCYAQMGLNEKAYYYLGIANNAHLATYTRVMVELLQRLNDPRAISAADEVMDGMGIKAEVDEGDMLDDNEAMKKFVANLRWNRALTLLKLGYTKAAKTSFEVLLHSQQYHDAAIQKLAEIEQMKLTGGSTSDNYSAD